MDRRRRLLGLKRPGTPEKDSKKPSRRMSTSDESSKSKSEDKTITRASQKNQPTGSVTPKQKTVISHSNVTPLKPESPCSPLQSPGCQMIFPGNLASPEIEVSWDWSCSQVPQEMLPPKRVKRVRDVKTQLPTLPTLSMHPRPRPPLQHQLTEEENQQRLEYYKNILSLNPTQSHSEDKSDSTNNNLKDVSSDDIKSVTTPKRPTTRLSSSMKKKDDDNSLFDDSANEFMFECSQAIEEKLKSGEIDMGPIIDIKIPQAKRTHSPGVDTVNIHKKTCHGRVNLFPERLNSIGICSKDDVDNKGQIGSGLPLQPITSRNNSYGNLSLVSESCDKKSEDKFGIATLSIDDIGKPPVGRTRSSQNSFNVNRIESHATNNIQNTNNSVQKSSINSNCQNVERTPLLAKPGHCVSNPASNTITSQNTCNGRLIKSVNVTDCSSIDKFKKPQNGNDTLLNNNQSWMKPQALNNNIVRSHQGVKREEYSTTNQGKEIQRPRKNLTTQDKSNAADVTSLLDDEFDLELSCLDVDSLCHSGETKQSQIAHATFSAPKICTQQEIEAKRLAALQKLKTKKKR